MEHIKDSINHIMLPFVGQIIIMCTTILMVSALQASSSFRQKTKEDTSHNEALGPNSTGSSSWRHMTNRDKRVVKMVTIISTIFMICNTPMVVGMTCRRAFPEFKINGVYHNVHLTLFAIVFIASSLSASVNTFVYYFGSSRFKQRFHEIFGLDENTIKSQSESKGKSITTGEEIGDGNGGR
ncbi:chemosensory receptor a [Plakobranchus ocellatus]|uniref:Chemosensory receptor a n=1 Tax=Plakobranchus ocellatus TaxID=259542 RepID=A0AAV4ASM5_9GAST|nr:chemosensory receptor a [Plakobranchus ocellatus]